MEDNLEDIDYFMKTLEEEKGQEILNLSKYVTSQAARVDDYKKQLMTVEQSRTDDKIAHTARVININDKYTNTKLMLISQMKLLSNCFQIYFYITLLNLFDSFFIWLKH